MSWTGQQPALEVFKLQQRRPLLHTTQIWGKTMLTLFIILLRKYFAAHRHGDFHQQQLTNDTHFNF
jgi:hypothetical protein